MNILYLADPKSIHDVRWINYFARQEGISCFVIVRACHSAEGDENGFEDTVKYIGVVQDHSTVRPFSFGRQVRRLESLLRVHRIDIFHVLYAEPNALWGVAKRRLKIPLILTTRGTDVLKTIPAFFERRDLLGRMVAKHYRSAFRNFSHITCTSFAQLNSLARLCKAAETTVVRTGVDFRLIAKVSGMESEGLPERPYVLMPRSMKPIYNHELTLDAIALLSSSVRKKYSFVFINSEADTDQYYREIVARANDIDAKIVFLEWVSHLKYIRLCNKASLVVMNPLSDGSPVTAMEAVACKTPVLLPPLDYDAVVFGNVFFFRSWSAESMKNEMERVLTMDERKLRTELETAYNDVYLNGNFETEMHKMHQIYLRVLLETSR